jgi:hypothetical protein
MKKPPILYLLPEKSGLDETGLTLTYTKTLQEAKALAANLGCRTLFRMRLYGNEPTILPGGWIRTGEAEWMFIKDFEKYVQENSCSHHYH